jgi:hypothetical protein
MLEFTINELTKGIWQGKHWRMRKKGTIVCNVSQPKLNTDWWKNLPIKSNHLCNMSPLLSHVHGIITNFKKYTHQNHKNFKKLKKNTKNTNALLLIFNRKVMKCELWNYKRPSYLVPSKMLKDLCKNTFIVVM